MAGNPKNIGASDNPPRPPSNRTIKVTSDGDDDESQRPQISFKLLLGGFVTAGILLIVFTAVRDADFPAWHEDMSTAEVTVVIPVLNEEKAIAECLQYLQGLAMPPHQIVVVDGGSKDRTVAIAKKEGVDVIKSQQGRAVQMNTGAYFAKGPLLCFVHADSRPPANFISLIRKTLSNGKVVMGGFRVIIEHKGRKLHWMTFHQLIKTYYAPLLFRPLSFFRGLRAMFGDQNIFCRKSDFLRADGFDEALPIMEDLDLVMRLHMAGPSTQQGDTQRSAAEKLYAKQETKVEEPRPSHTTISLPLEERQRLTKALIHQRQNSGLSASSPSGPSNMELQELLAAASAARDATPRSSEISSGQEPPQLVVIDKGNDGKPAGQDASRDMIINQMGSGSDAGSAPKQPVRGRRTSCRGKIKMILSPPSHSSGRRLAALGNIRGTWIHFRLATHWYFGGSVKELKKLYDRLYTDAYR